MLASPSNGLISYLGHSLGWVLPLCRDAVGVFYNPSQLDSVQWAVFIYKYSNISYICCFLCHVCESDYERVCKSLKEQVEPTLITAKFGFKKANVMISVLVSLSKEWAWPIKSRTLVDKSVWESETISKTISLSTNSVFVFWLLFFCFIFVLFGVVLFVWFAFMLSLSLSLSLSLLCGVGRCRVVYLKANSDLPCHLLSLRPLIQKWQPTSKLSLKMVDHFKEKRSGKTKLVRRRL